MTGSIASVPLYSEPVQRNEGLWARGLDAYPTSTAQALAATAEDAWVRNPTYSLFRMLRRERYAPTWIDETGHERPNEDVARLTPEEANKRFGIPGHLTFNAETAEPIAEELNSLKRDELARADVQNRSPGGVLQTVGQLGVGIGVSLADPINVGSAFIPIVGEARFAAWAARSVAGARLARGAIEGAAGAALVEPIVYGVAQSEQANYTALDSFLNVAFGTAIGGGLHVGLGALADRFGGRAIEDRETHLRAAVGDMVENGNTARSSAALAGDIGAAYDRVLRNPVGDPRETLASVPAKDIGDVLVRRGMFKDINDVEFSSSGYGLVKVIWKHGEQSDRPAGLRVERGDIVALPEIVRDFQPIEGSDPSSTRLNWVVERPDAEGRARKVVYGVVRFESPDGREAAHTMVTVHVEEPGRGRNLPLSRPKGADGASSPPGVISADLQGRVPNSLSGEAPSAKKVVPEKSAAANPDADKLPYVAVPAAPASLARFVRAAGGIKDLGGDVKALAGGKRQARGLVDAKNGTPLDELARAAWEAGYFPEHAERIDTNTFLDALSEDLAGKPRYRGADAEAIVERNHALAVNDEIDRLAGELGISARGKTYGQFFDAVAERVSADEAHAHAAKMADDIQAEYDRLAAGRKAFLEERGEAWEPDIYADPVHSADQLELDHEAGFRQGTGGRAGDAGAPGPAEGTAGGLPGDRGQGDARPGDGGDRGAKIDDPELRDEVAAADRELDALIRAGLPADDPELQAVRSYVDRVAAESRAREMAGFCLGRNA